MQEKMAGKFYFDIRQYDAMTIIAGKERRAGARRLMVALVFLSVCCSGIVYFARTAFISGIAGNAGQQQNVACKQVNKPLHRCKYTGIMGIKNGHFTLSRLALMATTMVLTLMSTAPAAGLSRIPLL